MRNSVPDLRPIIFRLAFAACFAISAASALATQSPMNACVNNLRQIDSAIQQWALENGVRDTNSCSLTNSQILAYIRNKAVLVCPEGGAYTAGRTITNWPECSVHGNPDTAWSTRERRVQEQRQANQSTVSVLIAVAVCVGGWWLIRRR